MHILISNRTIDGIQGRMTENWQHAVEQILLGAADSKARVVSVLSPDRGAGVSTLCRMLAETSSKSGKITLLIDLSPPIGTGAGADWAPGEGATEFIAASPEGYDRLSGNPSAATRPQFNNVDKLRLMFSEVLASYDVIIVDLPPPLEQHDAIINPTAAARASDAVIMVCVTGETTQQRVRKALSVLEAAGVQIGGTVLNDRGSAPLGVEIATGVRRLKKYLPGASRMATIAESNDFLNFRT